MKAVVVDSSNPDQLKVFGVSTAKTSRLLWCEMRAITDSGPSIWPIVQGLLQGRAALDWPLCWVPGREQLATAVLTLPDIPRREIVKVLPRELGQMTEASQALAASFTLGERVPDKNSIKQEVIATYLPREVLDQSLAQMRQQGLSPRWVLPEMVGHQQLLEKVRRKIKDELSGTVLFEVGVSRIAMTVYRGSFWGLQRVFGYRHQEGEPVGAEELERISVELNRSLQFFKQRYRRVHVDRLVVYGPSAARSEIAEHIRSSHALHVMAADPDLVSDRIDLGDTVVHDPDCLPAALVSLNLLPSLVGHAELDLLPDGYRDRDRSRHWRIGLVAAYALVVALLAVASFYLLGTRNEYRKQIDELNRVVNRQEAQNEQLLQTRRRRGFFYQYAHYKLWPRRFSAISGDFVRQLSLMVSPEIHLSELSLEARTHGAAFVLKGFVAATDSSAAQSLFIGFFDQIKALPDIISLDSADIKVNAARQEKSQAAVELYFSIDGEMEWP